MIKKICLLLFFGEVVFSLENNEDELLETTIDALNRTLNFVLDDYKAMNVDGIFGITEAEAHLKKAIVKVKNSNIRRKVIELIEKAHKIYQLQLPNLRSVPYKYYVFNNYVLPPEVWEKDIKFSYGKLNPHPEVHTGPYNTDNIIEYFDYIRNNSFSENKSDNCLVEVAAASNDMKPHHCPVSDFCVDYMLTLPTNYSDHFSGYGVTHMLILLQIARGRNCIMNETVTRKLIEKECSYVLWELRKNVQFGFVPNFDDLFLEQIGVCGSEGFGEFLEKAYLQHVLEMQDVHGGFAVKYVHKKDLIKTIRYKREASPMKYGTNNHTIGLAASVLALFIRVIIEKPFSNKAFY